MIHLHDISLFFTAKSLMFPNSRVGWSLKYHHIQFLKNWELGFIIPFLWKNNILRWWCFTYSTYLTEIPTIYTVLSWSNQLKSHWNFAAVSHLITQSRGTPLAAEGTMKYGWELGGKSNSQLGISSSSCEKRCLRSMICVKKRNTSI